MKKRLLSSMLLGLCVAIGSAVPAMADSRKVVTLGNDLTQEQKDTMMRYFGVGYDSVDMMYITNADEREHLGSYVPLEQIGNYTYSCALVAPTSTGGIQVKTANLEWVTCNMIASTLSTSGVTNCQVVAASPFKVSGTGALTGVIMAYEQASQKTLEPQKVELANQELVTTGNLANQVGQSKATAVINETKIQVIENNVTNIEEINNIVTNVSNEFDVQINEDQSAEIAELMQKIAEQEYDITQLKATLDRVQANVIGDAGASEEEVKAAEEKAEASEQAAEEAAKQEAQQNQKTELPGEDGIVIEETEETESILDNTDPGAFEGTGEIVEENDTTQSVQEQSEQKESEDLGIPEASDDGTMTEATEQTETPEETEAVSGDGMDASETEIPSDAGVVVPETELQPGDGAVIPETEIQQSEEADAAQTEAVLTEDDLKEEDKATYKEVKTALDEMFKTKELTFDDGTVVYLTEDAAKAVPEVLDEYLLNLLVRGEDAVAAEEEADPEINKNIVQETSELAPDKNYEDEQLKQADKFVRRLVFTDSEKLLEESQLENADKTLIYDKVMGILEKAYAPKDEAENAMTETPADGVTDEMIQDTGAVGDGTHMDQMEVPVDEFDGFEEETATF
ncbi:MAG: DUF1002 domain-containing protein [Marvinbryantia sp.]|jgi:uncharacterized protein YpuA (DUF1002 family)